MSKLERLINDWYMQHSGAALYAALKEISERLDKLEAGPNTLQGKQLPHVGYVAYPSKHCQEFDRQNSAVNWD